MSDAEYLIKREQQELEAALQSNDKRVRQVHLDLADAYTRRVNEAQRLEPECSLPLLAGPSRRVRGKQRERHRYSGLKPTLL